MGYIHFLDDWMLMSHRNMERRLGSPKYVPEATLEDGLTEGTWNFPMVARIPETGKYVALYGAACTPPSLEEFNKTLRFKARVQVLCYAESTDGIHWTRPDLRGKVSFPGPVYAPNQVWGCDLVVDGGPVYYDPYESNPNYRFKYVLSHMAGAPHEKGPKAMVTSPDGIHWELTHRFDNLAGTDSPCSVFYNPKRRCYVLNGREFGGDRRVWFRETTDWVNFSEPELIMHPDPEDPPLVGLYGMPVYEYEDIFIGLLWWIYCDPFTNGLPNGGMECALAYSYDGNHFNRLFHKPFIKRNELGDHGGGCIYTGCMLVDENHQIRFYSGGSKAEHFQNQELTDAALMLHTLRLDGFAYLATHAGRGWVRTKPFIITGDDLRINARSPYGGIRVRILDERAQEIPGFGFAECEPLLGDELFWSPRWNGRTFGDVKSDERRSLEFEIMTGELYGIRGDFQMLTSLWKKPTT
ncbi:MAG: hypothetical protein ACOX44_13770 [Limnochordia bacterium]